DLTGVQIGKGAHHQPTEGPACQHIGAANPSVDQCCMQLAGAVLNGAWVRADLAPAEPGPVIGNDADLLCQLGLHPMPEDAQTSHTAFEDDGGLGVVLAVDHQMQLEASGIAEYTWCRK